MVKRYETDAFRFPRAWRLPKLLVPVRQGMKATPRHLSISCR